MTEHITEALLWLFIMNLGIAFGAGLYEQRIILPQWFNRSPESGLRVDSEAMRRTDAGREFWAYVTTVPLTLLTLAVLSWPTSRKARDVIGGSVQPLLFSSNGSGPSPTLFPLRSS